MGFNATQRLGVMVLLLQWSHKVCTEGLHYNLHCVNDYVTSINCTLQCNLPSDCSSTWLKLTESYEENDYWCQISRVDEHFFCSVEIDSGFVDTDIYRIALCRGQNGTKSCELLDNEYKPVKTIKPKAPYCLTLDHNSSQSHFSWKSPYENSNFTYLMKYLTYQLRFYKKGRQYTGIAHNVNTEKTTYTFKDDIFTPDTEYAAKVRSSPNGVFYKGNWSDWSAEVQWRSDPAVHENNMLVFNLEKVIIPVCVLVPIILILCFVPIKKWKQSVFIPTPEPYFETLYSDCHGDFKSWVIMKEETVDIPKTEKTFPIDKLAKCKDVANPEVSESSGYMNMSEPDQTVFEQGLPYAASTSGLGSATASYMSTYLSPQSRSPAEGDSGCWLSSDQSLEKGPPWYCNDYCTLSTFQQSALGTS